MWIRFPQLHRRIQTWAPSGCSYTHSELHTLIINVVLLLTQPYITSWQVGVKSSQFAKALCLDQSFYLHYYQKGANKIILHQFYFFTPGTDILGICIWVYTEFWVSGHPNQRVTEDGSRFLNGFLFQFMESKNSVPWHRMFSSWWTITYAKLWVSKL